MINTLWFCTINKKWEKCRVGKSTYEFGKKTLDFICKGKKYPDKNKFYGSGMYVDNRIYAKKVSEMHN